MSAPAGGREGPRNYWSPSRADKHGGLEATPSAGQVVLGQLRETTGARVEHVVEVGGYAVLMRSTCGFPSSTDKMASYLPLAGSDVGPKNS